MYTKKWRVVYAVLSLAAFSAMLFLFWAQSIKLNDQYPSDLYKHISSALANGGSSYSLQSKLIMLLHSITRNTFGVCVLLAAIVTATPLAVGWMLSAMDDPDSAVQLGRTRCNYIGLYSIFVAPLVIPVIWVRFYRNTMNINSWHNPTTMEMRLFSVIAFALFIQLQKAIGNHEKISFWKWIAFSAALLISTWFKPSFFVGFALVMAASIGIDVIRNRRDRKRVVRNIGLCFTVVPAVTMVILQYWKLYGSRDDVSLILSTKYNTLEYAIITVIFLIIPVTILLYNRKQIIQEYRSGNRAYVQAWTLWGIELLYHQLLSEEGRSGGNFGWGVRIGNFFVFVVSMRLFWRNVLSVRRKRANHEKIGLWEWIYLFVIGFALLWELGCGIYYFIVVCQGNHYFF